MAFYHCFGITSIRLPDTLTSIGEFALALSDSTRLQGGLPASLEHIGRCGFQSCQLGDVLRYPCTDDVREEAFNWIQGANKIVVPEGVTRLPDGVSWESSDAGVATVSGDGTVTAVGPGSAILTARYGSIALQATVYVHDGIEYSPDGKTLLYCSENYAGRVEVPEGVEEIAAHAFADCARITEIQLPDTLRRLGERAFERFGYGLSAPLTIPGTHTCIGPCAYSVANISTDSLLIPSCTLGEGAFSMASGFSRVVLSCGIAEVPSCCFACTYIQEIVVPKTVTRISLDAFNDRYTNEPLVIFGEAGSYVRRKPLRGTAASAWCSPRAVRKSAPPRSGTARSCASSRSRRP